MKFLKATTSLIAALIYLLILGIIGCVFLHFIIKYW